MHRIEERAGIDAVGAQPLHQIVAHARPVFCRAKPDAREPPHAHGIGARTLPRQPGHVAKCLAIPAVHLSMRRDQMLHLRQL